MNHYKSLPESLNPEDCNCQQCKELRVYLHVKEYFSNPANCVSLTVNEFFTFFWGVKLIRKDSIADTLINKTVVLCKDGFIRPR